MSKSTGLIQTYLKKNGPALSSEVAEYLRQRGFSAPNSRKAIQRADSNVFKLSKIRFKHNDQFLYLSNEYRSSRFFQNLLSAFTRKESVYGLALNSLIARDGLVAKPFFDIISGSPVLMKRQLSGRTVLERLVELGMLDVVDHADLGACVSLTPALANVSTSLKPNAFRARLLAEDILLGAMKEWLRNLGLGSYNQVQIRSLKTQPQFGQFKWDLSAPSYIHPLSRYDSSSSRLRPGFIVADVLLGHEVGLQHLRYFLKKNSLMRSQRTTSPFLTFFVCERFTKEAFQAGRKAGLVLATTENLFGREIASGLAELVQVLTNAAFSVASNPQLIDKLFSKLDAIKGVELTVRGALFELLFARCLALDGWHISAMNEQVKDPDDGSLAEIDILAIRGNTVLITECKAYRNNAVTRAEVETWIKKGVPRIRNVLLQDRTFKHRDLCFQFCTTACFKPDALDLLNERATATTKYSIVWKDRAQLDGYIQGLKNSHVLDLLRKYYPS